MTERQQQLQYRQQQQQRYQTSQQQRYQQANRDIKIKSSNNQHSSKIRFDDSDVYFTDITKKSYSVYDINTKKAKQYMIDASAENEYSVN